MAILQSDNLIELLTPKQNSPDFENDLKIFSVRFNKIREYAAVVSIPDNPLGNLHFAAPEVLSYLALPIDPEKCLIHLNTFHARKDLDDFLRQAKGLRIKYLLCVSGDGSQRLARLNPADLDTDVETVTSVELLAYIDKACGGHFTCGVAFNQYEPMEHEMQKMRRKLAAGAKFIITQPVVGRDERVLELAHFGMPVSIGAWMSKRIDLLKQCLGVAGENIPADYDPLENLRVLRATYPDYGLYYSLLGFNRDWNGIITH